jgi:Fe-S cluster biosynthesis and repair protein YggX
MPHMVFCAKYKQEMEGLDEPPFDSDFGHKIYNSVSKKAWGEWIEHQKMLLNEYRLLWRRQRAAAGLCSAGALKRRTSGGAAATPLRPG